MRVRLRACKVAVNAAVETAGWLVVNQVDKMVGQTAACWDKRLVLMRVGLNVDERAEEVASEKDG